MLKTKPLPAEERTSFQKVKSSWKRGLEEYKKIILFGSLLIVIVLGVSEKWLDKQNQREHGGEALYFSRLLISMVNACR